MCSFHLNFGCFQLVEVTTNFVTTVQKKNQKILRNGRIVLNFSLINSVFQFQNFELDQVQLAKIVVVSMALIFGDFDDAFFCFDDFSLH